MNDTEAGMPQVSLPVVFAHHTSIRRKVGMLGDEEQRASDQPSPRQMSQDKRRLSGERSAEKKSECVQREAQDNRPRVEEAGLVGRIQSANLPETNDPYVLPRVVCLILLSTCTTPLTCSVPYPGESYSSHENSVILVCQ